jgi:hypothetical protein
MANLRNDRYSRLFVSGQTYAGDQLSSYFTTGSDYLELGSVRDFGSLAEPYTAKSDPVFGAATQWSQPTQAATTELSLVLNLDTEDWALGHPARQLWRDRSTTRVWCLVLADSPQPGRALATWDAYGILFLGQPGQLSVSLSLQDATTVTCSVLVSSPLQGPYNFRLGAFDFS